MKLNDENVVVVESLTDLKRAVLEFTTDKKHENPDVHATIKVGSDTWDLSAPTDCSYREMLAEGFEIVKKRMDALGRRESEGVGPVSVGGHMWLDDLITRRLGGARDGMRVRWDLPEGTFFFNPFNQKLTKQC